MAFLVVHLTFFEYCAKRLTLAEKWKLHYHQHWTGFHIMCHRVIVKYAVFELSRPENDQVYMSISAKPRYARFSSWCVGKPVGRSFQNCFHFWLPANIFGVINKNVGYPSKPCHFLITRTLRVTLPWNKMTPSAPRALTHWDINRNWLTDWSGFNGT